jgi:hypothetical protein
VYQTRPATSPNQRLNAGTMRVFPSTTFLHVRAGLPYSRERDARAPNLQLHINEPTWPLPKSPSAKFGFMPRDLQRAASA